MAGATHKHTAAGGAADRAMTTSVPVLVITGPVGVGKSTIAAEAAWLLRQADVPHALIDLDRIEQSWPVPADDPGNEKNGPERQRLPPVSFRDWRRTNGHTAVCSTGVSATARPRPRSAPKLLAYEHLSWSRWYRVNAVRPARATPTRELAQERYGPRR
jgi:hypothetical protein